MHGMIRREPSRPALEPPTLGPDAAGAPLLPYPFFMKKILVILALLLALGAGGFVLTRKHFSGPKEDEIADNLRSVAEKRDIEDTIEVSGDVMPFYQLDVKPEVGGKLMSLKVKAGDVVKEGDILVKIDDTDLVKARQSSATEIDGAKLTVDRAQKNFNRGKELFEAKLISQEAFDNLYADLALAQNALTKAQAAIEEIEEQLKRTNVTSPTDGTVLTVPVTEGQVMIAAASVNSGTTMMTIANLSKLLVQVHINQVDVARLQIDKMVKLRAESLHDLDMNAKISFIAPVATVMNNVKGFDVQATIEKPNPRLRCGMTVNMTVPIARAQSAISVPISAIFKGEGNSKVVYVRSGEQTVKRPVKIGVTNIDFAEILKGVNEGEEILLVEPDSGTGGAQKKS